MKLPASLDGWMPVGISWQARRCLVEWCDFTGVKLTDRFFDETVSHVLQNPCRNILRLRTDMEDLCGHFAPQAENRPGGMVFHLSRSGSTLLSRMLGAPAGNIMLSEPAPLDQFLRLRHQARGVPEETWGRWLRGLLGVMGRRRFPGEDAWFVKWDALHTFDLPFITAALPGVPWVFLDRDVLEVIAAHLQLPGRAMMPGAFLPGREELFTPLGTPPEDHIARILAGVRRAAREARAAGGLWIDHSQLPWSTWPGIVRHFHLNLSAGDEALVAAAAGRDSKAPDRSWQDDREAKMALITPAIREAAARWCGETSIVSP